MRRQRRPLDERIRAGKPLAWFYRVVGVEGEDPTGKLPSSWYLTTDPDDFRSEGVGGYVYQVVPLVPESPKP